MLKLREGFKMFPIETCKNHCRIGILMIDIAIFIYGNGSRKPINCFKLVKGFLKGCFKAHTVSNPCYNFCGSSITYNIFSHSCTAYCTE